MGGASRVGRSPCHILYLLFFFFLRGRGIEKAPSGVVEGRGEKQILAERGADEGLRPSPRTLGS